MRVNCDKEGIKQANNTIKKGGVVIFPTDTVYGIGCDPYNKNAVEKIYKMKSREKSKPLPVLIYSKGAAKSIASFDKDSEKLADKFWPGSLTLILKIRDEKLKESMNLGEKIAIRIPNNKCTLELLKKCKFITGTSANISGQESFIDPDKCYQNISGFDLFLDGGKISGGVPSTIAEIINGELQIQREGVLTKKELMKIL